jgi:hypothetical protein
MARFKIGVSRRPDGRYEFTEPDNDLEKQETWDRETVVTMAEVRLGTGRLVENVDGVFWVTPEPEFGGES